MLSPWPTLTSSLAWVCLELYFVSDSCTLFIWAVGWSILLWQRSNTLMGPEVWHRIWTVACSTEKWDAIGCSITLGIGGFQLQCLTKHKQLPLDDQVNWIQFNSIRAAWWCTVASQQKGPWFESRGFLCGVFMFFLCPAGTVSSHSPKTCLLG